MGYLIALAFLGNLAFGVSQNLLLIGGGLEDDNAAVYEKVVELAVSCRIQSELRCGEKCF